MSCCYCDKVYKFRISGKNNEPEENDVPEENMEFVSHIIVLRKNNTGIERILSNNIDTVPVRLLAFKEIKNPCAVSCHMDLAHLSVYSEISNSPVNCYIIAFVEATRNGKDINLVKKLTATVKYLEIENENPHFYIFYYGDNPVIELTINEARNFIHEELKDKYRYRPDEKFCFPARARIDSQNITISSSNPYMFNVN
jgi:hypothetical protein